MIFRERIPGSLALRRDMNNTLVLALEFVLVLGTGTHLSAQSPGAAPDPILVRVVPRVGLLSPDTYLYEQYSNFSGDGPVEWTSGFMGRALVLGLGFEAGRTGGGILLRGEVLRSFGGWLTAAHSIVVPRQLFDPPYVQTTWLDVPAAVTTTSLQVVVPTRLILRQAQPYFLVGVAGKRYSFGESAPANEVAAILPESGLTWGADVGAGGTVPIRGLALDLQFRDTINRYWGKTEHDLVFSMGLMWRVR